MDFNIQIPEKNPGYKAIMETEQDKKGKSLSGFRLCRYPGRPLADLWPGMRWDGDEPTVHILIPVTINEQNVIYIRYYFYS